MKQSHRTGTSAASMELFVESAEKVWDKVMSLFTKNII
jgi:hypothetical protein